MPKFAITTMGCKVNQFESEAIAQYLKASGWTMVRDEGESNVHIINTCTVTQKASSQSRQAIRKAIRSHPHARIIVTGCDAQMQTEEIQKIKGVHDIIGHGDKHKIPEMILSSSLPEHLPYPVTICRDILHEYRFRQIPIRPNGNRTRPFLKIQDGCDAFCTYCIVPYARGPSRSMPLKSVLKNIGQIKRAGFHEVVLSGIHLGSYGLDLVPKTSLTALLKSLENLKPINRIRLSSIEPRELTDEIIKLVSESEILCRHFHIPLQSGDDLILKKMHRPYTGAFFSNRVSKIHESIPDAAIGVDLLVGFPGETEAAFENTYTLIQALPVTYLHIFPFSARKGTPASKFSDPVPVQTIKERCQILRELSLLKKSIFYNKFLHKKVEVLIEGRPYGFNHLLKGITSNYIPVFIKGEDDIKNTLVRVSIDKVNDNSSLFGVIYS
jgi:threonylcarbamoyladenosine tRNA methylthiotransferase MtaB